MSNKYLLYISPIEDESTMNMSQTIAKNIPPYSIAVGNPCKIIKQRDISKYNDLKDIDSIYLKLKNTQDR